jgi:hypothetical protein
LLRKGRNGLDLRDGTGISKDKEALSRLDTVKKSQRVALDFLDGNCTHDGIIINETGRDATML